MKRTLTQCVGVGVISAVIYIAGFAAVTHPPFSADRPRIAPIPAPAFASGPRAWYDSTQAGIPVLCHHYFRGRTTPAQVFRILGALFLNLPLLDDMDVWTQSSEVFEAQMEYLSREGYESVGLEDVAAWQRGAGTLPPKPVVITIDDGDRSIVEHAYPILKRLGFKATLFVVTSEVGKRWDRVDCLDWDELARLEGTGVFTVESHSHDLHRKVSTGDGDLPVYVAAKLGLYDFPGFDSWQDAVFDDLSKSKRSIEQHLGGHVSSFAWPYGFGDAELDSVAAAAGFHVLCTMGAGSNLRIRFFGDSRPWQLLEIRRYTITARTSLRTFERIIAADIKSAR
jgi:peptidoglycan/xylan/chitin deacetylase (PgdA/CDA1 family)